MADMPEPPEQEEPKKSLVGRARESIAKTQQVAAEKNQARQEAQQTQQAEQQAPMAQVRARYATAGHTFMEYGVAYVRESLIGDKINVNELRLVMNKWGEQGWHVRTVTSAQVGGRIGPGGVSGLIVTFERPRLD